MTKSVLVVYRQKEGTTLEEGYKDTPQRARLKGPNCGFLTHIFLIKEWFYKV